MPLLKFRQVFPLLTMPKQLPKFLDTLPPRKPVVRELQQTGSGGAVSGVPTRKCPGVRGSESLESLFIGVKGREFRHASIKARSVYISSCAINKDPTTRLKCCLNDLTPASNIPPMYSEFGGINFQAIPSLLKCATTSVFVAHKKFFNR